MAESYKRAYLSKVTAQTLAEMEETIEFRKLEERSIATGQRHPLNRPDKEETRNRVLLTWRRRLVGNHFDADVHASIMAVRSFVLGPTDEVDATVTLSNLYRQAQRYKLSERVLLDPLANLGANLNGPVFGFGLPESLSLGLPRVENVNAGQVIVNRLVCGDRYQ
jgi:FAT domain